MNKELIIQRYKSPKNEDTLPNGTISKSSNASCGDEVSLYLDIQNGIVVDAKYMGSGCSICLACSDLLIDEIKGKGIEELKEMEENYILKLIDIDETSPRRVCATLCMKALTRALNK